MRCWKNALDEISDYYAHRTFPRSATVSDTQKALDESLRQLELQCMERIDLLEALRISRQQHSAQPLLTVTGEGLQNCKAAEDPHHQTKGWIGQGTIPAVTYPELSRPNLPRRQTLPDRVSSDRTRIDYSASSTSTANGTPCQGREDLPSTPSRNLESARPPSPRKHTMRSTLRSSKTEEKQHKLSNRLNARPSDGPGANRAAAMAWSTSNSKDAASESNAEETISQPTTQARPERSLRWDSHTRRLVSLKDARQDSLSDPNNIIAGSRHSSETPRTDPSPLSISAASSAINSRLPFEVPKSSLRTPLSNRTTKSRHTSLLESSIKLPRSPRPTQDKLPGQPSAVNDRPDSRSGDSGSVQSNGRPASTNTNGDGSSGLHHLDICDTELSWSDGMDGSSQNVRLSKMKGKGIADSTDPPCEVLSRKSSDETPSAVSSLSKKITDVLRNLPAGVDDAAAKQILNEIVVQGDEVRWNDIAGLEIAKAALREAVVYPFLRPDLFMGLREPVRGMLLFGPPGTGKTMLARAVATESRSTFFSISASSLTSKYLGESEKLVRALFSLAKVLSPSIIFVDEIDSLLSQRAGSGEHEATRRLKTEFLIQWSDLQRSAAGRDAGERDRERGDASRVLVLAATNLPWLIDEAARRRFVRRQYIPLPESQTRASQIRNLLIEQNHDITAKDIDELVELTEGELESRPVD
jgi:fidgetin-like protein 1